MRRFIKLESRVAFGVQSDSVRRPIGFRSVSDRIAFGVQSDCVRRPIGLNGFLLLHLTTD